MSSKIVQVSARSWDQNESLGQFAGKHILLPDGAHKIVEAMSEGTEVKLKSQVPIFESKFPSFSDLIDNV